MHVDEYKNERVNVRVCACKSARVCVLLYGNIQSKPTDSNMKILFWPLYQMQVIAPHPHPFFFFFFVHTPHLPSSILISSSSLSPSPYIVKRNRITSPSSLLGPTPHQCPPPPPAPSSKLYPGDNDAVDRSLFKLFIRRSHAFSDSSFAYYVYTFGGYALGGGGRGGGAEVVEG